MSLAGIERSASRVPDGYCVVPVTENQIASPLRICLLVRRLADPVAGHLVLLRDQLDARVYLGCVCDATDRVKQWIEIWVQQVDGLAGPIAGLKLTRGALTNQALDDHWRNQLAHLDDADFGSVIRTGWEHQSPGAIFIDLRNLRPVQPRHAGQPLTLCRDDSLLLRKELPMYATTLHRYLYQPDLGEDSPFWPATANACANQFTRPLDALNPTRLQLIPFNASGALMMVRTYSPFGLNQLIQKLAGGNWTGVPHGTSQLRLGLVPAEGEDADKFGGWMFLERHGKSARFVEAFHLKVRCLLDLVTLVRELTYRTQRPLLNLRPESFQIISEGGGAALPVLWTCRARLIDPGNAVAVKIPSGDSTYFLPGCSDELSIYQPWKTREFQSGRGEFWIHQLVSASDNRTILQGVFQTREPIIVASNDLIWFRMHLKGQHFDLCAKLDSHESPTQGELSVQTLATQFDETIISALHSAGGVALQDLPFEVVPHLSSPCDLYSLGILAVQILLLRPDTNLAQCVSNMTSLCRKLAGNYDPGLSRQLRIQAIFADDKRFFDVLGPHRLVSGQGNADLGFQDLPEELWWETLAAIVPMFPGLGPDSACNHLGDAPTDAIHRIFDITLDALWSIVTRSRSLLMNDWHHNRQIHAVVKKIRETALH